MILKELQRYKKSIIYAKKSVSELLNKSFSAFRMLVTLFLLVFLFVFNPFMLESNELCSSNNDSQVAEKVVAYVEDEAITLTELNKSLREMRAKDPNITKEEVINMLINRLLLLKEAKNMKLDTLTTSKDIIDDYIDIKIKSLIFIRDEEIQRFYDDNKGQFQDINLSKVRDKIETYLIEKETNKRLKEHIETLRNNTYWAIN